MTEIAFGDGSSPPTPEDLAEALGRASGRWDELIDILAEAHGPLTRTWKYWKTSGWTHQVARKKRTILWMTPASRHFRIATTYGEKAVAAAVESDLPEDLVESIGSSRKYAEGRAVRFEVRTKADVDVVRRIAAIKMAN